MQFVGISNRVFLTYPVHILCDYDPRTRPWYLSSVTGSKNVGIIFDSSLSIKTHNRHSICVEIVENIVNYLSVYDHFGGVSYSNKHKVINSKFIRANSVNKSEFIKKIKKIPFNGNTNYKEAFAQVFSELKTSFRNNMLEMTTQNIIIFICDNLSSEYNTSAINELVLFIKVLESEYHIKPKIFIYIIGENIIFAEPLYMLANEFDGFTEIVQYNTEVKAKTEKLFNFLGSELFITQVVWTEPYQDKQGLGMMTTAAIPFYDQIHRELIGVVGVDVLLKTVLEFVSESEFVQRIIYNPIINNPLHNDNEKSFNNNSLSKSTCNLNIDIDPFKERQQLLTSSNIQNCCGENICKSLISSTYSYITQTIIAVSLLIIIIGFIYVKISHIYFENVNNYI